MSTSQRSARTFSLRSSHLNISQKTTAVKNELKAYTSASTALNQKESENV